MTLFDLPRGFVLTFLFVTGCCIGSFLNVCIHRFPTRIRLRDQLKTLVAHGSGCPRCAASIRWFDNIPVLGWLMLRGRCRDCRRPISCRYPFVELLTGILFVVVYQIEMPADFFSHRNTFGIRVPNGPQNITGLWRPEIWLHARYALHIAMICCLIVATFIDLELRIIPDGSTIPMMAVGLIVSTAVGQTFLVPVWFQDSSVVQTLRSVTPDWMQPLIISIDAIPFAIRHPHLHGFLVSLAGLVIGGGTVWLVRLAGFWVLRQEAMGFGDVILMAMVGSVIGWQPVTVVFFIAPVLAIFAAVFAWLTRREKEIPYGPWLSIATLLLLLTWPVIWPGAERVFDMGPFVPMFAVIMFVSLLASLMLIQIVKRMLGIDTSGATAPHDGGWTSADHLSYYNGERPDVQSGQWSVPLWPGQRAGSGLGAYHRWRYRSQNER